MCRCVFVSVVDEICFRLLWWGKENEHFGKTIFIVVLGKRRLSLIDFK